MITMGQMLGFTNRLKEIQKVQNAELKNQRLANLMSDMEQTFNIPALRDESFEIEHPLVMRLYETINQERQM